MPELDNDCLGEDDDGHSCGNKGRDEFVGFCAKCWLKLDSDERQALALAYVPNHVEPPAPVIRQTVQPVIERIKIVKPPYPYFRTALVILWRVVVTAALLWPYREWIVAKLSSGL